MRALVTGCAGFIGSHLTERLIDDGWQVTGIDSFTNYYDPIDKAENLSGLRDEPRFDLVADDLMRADLATIMRDSQVVFHLAAQPGVRGSFGRGFDQYVRDNVVATQRVFEAALDASCARVVYASSSSVYGDAEHYPCPETARLLPRSPYGVTKATCETLAGTYGQLGLRTVGLRYFTVYGPRQRPDMAIRRLCEAALGGPRFELLGDGSQTRDFTYVSDAVDATIRSAVHDSGSILNIGGGQEASMRDIIGLVAALVPSAPEVRQCRPERGDVNRTGADTKAARRQLDWAPRVPLSDGLREELAWVRERRNPRSPVRTQLTVGGTR